jgi:hypothetical protein
VARARHRTVTIIDEFRSVKFSNQCCRMLLEEVAIQCKHFPEHIE